MSQPSSEQGTQLFQRAALLREEAVAAAAKMRAMEGETKSLCDLLAGVQDNMVEKDATIDSLRLQLRVKDDLIAMLQERLATGEAENSAQLNEIENLRGQLFVMDEVVVAKIKQIEEQQVQLEERDRDRDTPPAPVSTPSPSKTKRGFLRRGTSSPAVTASPALSHTSEKDPMRVVATPERQTILQLKSQVESLNHMLAAAEVKTRELDQSLYVANVTLREATDELQDRDRTIAQLRQLLQGQSNRDTQTPRDDRSDSRPRRPARKRHSQRRQQEDWQKAVLEQFDSRASTPARSATPASLRSSTPPVRAPPLPPTEAATAPPPTRTSASSASPPPELSAAPPPTRAAASSSSVSPPPKKPDIPKLQIDTTGNGERAASQVDRRIEAPANGVRANGHTNGTAGSDGADDPQSPAAAATDDPDFDGGDSDSDGFRSPADIWPPVAATPPWTSFETEDSTPAPANNTSNTLDAPTPGKERALSWTDKHRNFGDFLDELADNDPFEAPPH